MIDHQPGPANPDDTAAIFQPLELGGLTLKNRLVRSSISGRIDNYDGSGTPARVNFEERFARGGVAAILSSHVPIAPEARVLPHYAMIDRDERVAFWRTVGRRVHAHDYKFILQLSHSGRQQDIAGVENFGRLPGGVTTRGDLFQGLRSRAMPESEIRRVVELFAHAAERVRRAELDGIELHSANGYPRWASCRAPRATAWRTPSRWRAGWRRRGSTPCTSRWATASPIRSTPPDRCSPRWPAAPTIR